MADKVDPKKEEPEEPKEEPKTEEPKKEDPWWIALIIGIAMLAGSVFVYFDLTNFEEQGGQRRMHWLAVLLYKWLGKWGIVVLMVVVGLAITLYGISQLRNRLASKKEIEEEEEEGEEPRPRKRRPREDDE